MIIFGDEAAYNMKGTKKYGWVLAALPVERSDNKFGEVGTLIYVGVDEPIYLVPTSFFHPSEEQLLELSNTQRRKRTTNFEEGDPVEFAIGEDDRVIWVTRQNHGKCQIELDKTTKNLFFISLIVKTEDRIFMGNRACIPYVDPSTLWEVEPNVAYSIYFRIHLSYGSNEHLSEQAYQLRLGTFKPTFTIKFDTFGTESNSEEGKQLVEEAMAGSDAAAVAPANAEPKGVVPTTSRTVSTSQPASRRVSTGTPVTGSNAEPLGVARPTVRPASIKPGTAASSSHGALKEIDFHIVQEAVISPPSCPATSATVAKIIRLPCPCCDHRFVGWDESEARDELEMHLYTTHYNCLPFNCGECTMKLPSECALRKHFGDCHGGVEALENCNKQLVFYSGGYNKRRVEEMMMDALRAAEIVAVPQPIQVPCGGGERASPAEAAQQHAPTPVVSPPAAGRGGRQTTSGNYGTDGHFNSECPYGGGGRTHPAGTQPPRVTPDDAAIQHSSALIGTAEPRPTTGATEGPIKVTPSAPTMEKSFTKTSAKGTVPLSSIAPQPQAGSAHTLEEVLLHQPGRGTRMAVTTIHVGKLHATVTEDELRQRFGQFGQIQVVRLQPMGTYAVAFIRYHSEIAAATAIFRSSLSVSWAHTNCSYC